MFNQGDIVECTLPPYPPMQGPGSGWSQGFVFTVMRVDKDPNYSDGSRDIVWPYQGSGVYAEYLTLRGKTNEAAQQKEAETPKSASLDFSPLSRLIIAKEAKEEIISVLKQHEHSQQIFEEWGLGEVIEYGRGMSFLFYGPPGTGKTWAAHCIAKSLGKELLVLSAGEIQSSEPGAANRNIEQAFRSAKSSKKVLFMDECDSIIASRDGVGMVLGSEINTLLTEIEKFEGVCVLATNRIEELDEALERRISLILEFPEPNYEQREDIWKRMLPTKMPLEKEVTNKVLAEHKLTGGQIKNVVLQAARLALAEDAKKVGLNHFQSAIARVQKSKSLMGTASRYRQVMVKESMGIGKRKKRSDIYEESPGSSLSESRGSSRGASLPADSQGSRNLPN